MEGVPHELSIAIHQTAIESILLMFNRVAANPSMYFSVKLPRGSLKSLASLLAPARPDSEADAIMDELDDQQVLALASPPLIGDDGKDFAGCGRAADLLFFRPVKVGPGALLKDTAGGPQPLRRAAVAVTPRTAGRSQNGSPMWILSCPAPLPPGKSDNPFCIAGLCAGPGSLGGEVGVVEVGPWPGPPGHEPPGFERDHPLTKKIPCGTTQTHWPPVRRVTAVDREQRMLRVSAVTDLHDGTTCPTSWVLGFDAMPFSILQSLRVWEAAGAPDMQLCDDILKQHVHPTHRDEVPGLYNDVLEAMLGGTAAIDKTRLRNVRKFAMYDLVGAGLLEVVSDTQRIIEVKPTPLCLASLSVGVDLKMKRTMLAGDPDIALEDCTAWELLQRLLKGGWSVKEHASGAKLPPYKVGEALTMYIKSGAARINRLYALCLLKAEPDTQVEHMQTDRYYKELLGMRVEPLRGRKRGAEQLEDDEFGSAPKSRRVARRRQRRALAGADPLAALELGEAAEGNIDDDDAIMDDSDGAPDAEPEPGSAPSASSKSTSNSSSSSGSSSSDSTKPVRRRVGRGTAWPSSGPLAGKFSFIQKPAPRCSIQMTCKLDGHGKCSKTRNYKEGGYNDCLRELKAWALAGRFDANKEAHFSRWPAIAKQWRDGTMPTAERLEEWALAEAPGPAA